MVVSLSALEPAALQICTAGITVGKILRGEIVDLWNVRELATNGTGAVADVLVWNLRSPWEYSHAAQIRVTIGI